MYFFLSLDSGSSSSILFDSSYISFFPSSTTLYPIIVLHTPCELRPASGRSIYYYYLLLVSLTSTAFQNSSLHPPLSPKGPYHLLHRCPVSPSFSPSVSIVKGGGDQLANFFFAIRSTRFATESNREVVPYASAPVA